MPRVNITDTHVRHKFMEKCAHGCSICNDTAGESNEQQKILLFAKRAVLVYNTHAFVGKLCTLGGTMMMKLAPSILSADFANLGADIKIVDQSAAEYVHIDIMDGLFVPATSFGAPVVRAIRSYTDKVFDVHLMIQNPDAHIKSFVEAGADLITVHIEACTHVHRTIQSIKQYGKKAGVVLNPATPLDVLDYILEDVDMVLLMSVNPGFGGQKYIPAMTEKITRLRKMIEERNLTTDIEVDGGVHLDNVQMIAEAGANVIVAGSAIFGGNTAQNIEQFVKILKGVTR